MIEATLERIAKALERIALSVPQTEPTADYTGVSPVVAPSPPKPRGRKPAAVGAVVAEVVAAPVVAPEISFDAPEAEDFLDISPAAPVAAAPEPVLTLELVRDALIAVGNVTTGQKILAEKGKVERIKELKPENFKAVYDAAKAAKK